MKNYPMEIWLMINAYRAETFKKRCKDLESIIRFPTPNVNYTNLFDQSATYTLYVPSVRAARLFFSIDYTVEHGTGKQFLNRFYYVLPYRETDYGFIQEKTFFKLDDGTALRAKALY